MIVLIMGVLGAGKSTVGSLLARQLGWQFVDADSFHSPANVEKMRRGIPLTDSDRAPWLEAIHQAIQRWVSEGRNVVLACSALKRGYREKLMVPEHVKLVYLKAPYEYILSRLRRRKGHFASEDLLLSQFSDLEEPTDALVVDASQSPQRVVDAIRAAL